MSTPRPEPTIEERHAAQLATLHDPFAFARVMRESVFYATFNSLFYEPRESVTANWDRAIEHAEQVSRTGSDAQRVEAFRLIADLRTDLLGDVLDDIGLPQGIALERIRQAMIDCLATIKVLRDGRAARYERDAKEIAELVARIDHDEAAAT